MYDRTTVQGATFSIRDQLYRGNANATALFSSPVVSALVRALVNDQNYTFGEYCGRRTGQTVAVYGKFALITFHSDPSVEKRGFFFHFKTVSPGLYSY